jgi:hypothetical protein
MNTSPTGAQGDAPESIAPTAKRPYQPPNTIRLGKAEVLTRGMGDTWTDYLGDPTTRYGK